MARALRYGLALLALAAPAAQAEWLYVPPEVPETLTVAPAEAAAPAAVPEPEPEPPVWEVRDGEFLRDALGRWSAQEDVAVVWLTDRRWRIEETREIRGEFADAVAALLAALAHLPRAPVAELDGDALVVAHRPPEAAP